MECPSLTRRGFPISFFVSPFSPFILFTLKESDSLLCVINQSQYVGRLVSYFLLYSAESHTQGLGWHSTSNACNITGSDGVEGR